MTRCKLHDKSGREIGCRDWEYDGETDWDEIHDESHRSYRPTLAEVGIDKKLSSRSQAIASIPEDDFERTLSEHREQQEAVTARTMETLARQGEKHTEAQRKDPRIALLADAIKSVKAVRRESSGTIASTLGAIVSTLQQIRGEIESV